MHYKRKLFVIRVMDVARNLGSRSLRLPVERAENNISACKLQHHIFFFFLLKIVSRHVAIHICATHILQHVNNHSPRLLKRNELAMGKFYARNVKLNAQLYDL